MLLYVLKLNQNAKMPEAYGKYYAYPVITQTVDIDGGVFLDTVLENER